MSKYQLIKNTFNGILFDLKYNFFYSKMSETKNVYPADINAYHILREIGQGSSATVYKAKCIPLNEIVAIKIIDLERVQGALQDALVCICRIFLVCFTIINVRFFFTERDKSAFLIITSMHC